MKLLSHPPRNFTAQPTGAKRERRFSTRSAHQLPPRAGLDDQPVSLVTAAGGKPALRGVALVVTLILLAIITTLAIAFIALTHRETSAVAATSSTTDAELAAEAALERAKAEILAPFVRDNRGTNGKTILGPEMMVSVAVDQDRIKAYGAYVDPSPPVYVNTNISGGSGPLDDRHFLDLNRNRYFDETGLVPITVNAKGGDGRYARAFPESDGWNATNFVAGDPQWIGVLANPLRWHTNNNQYISRFAYLVLPAGRSLDLNAIHNQAIDLDMRAGGFNGYYRNQGVGGWELNLAGFLTDLNTNEWPAPTYLYDPFNAVATGIANGPAFNDAREILRYRYTPANVQDLLNPPVSPNRYLDYASSNFPPIGVFAGDPVPSTLLTDDNIDEYSDSRLIRTSFAPLSEFDDPNKDNPDLPWPGARNKRNLRSIHDLWDPAKFPDANGIRRRLSDSSSRGNSYDRYTYYRVLGQLGTDSVTEDEDKINLNYVNVRSWSNPGFRLEAADMVSWTNSTANFKAQMGRTGPDLFFLSVARKLFMQEPALRGLVTNGTSLPATPLRIPILTNGSRLVIQRTNNVLETNVLYSGRIHQILQQAANIYDAIRGVEPGERPPYFPTIFRPKFRTEGNDVFVVDYERLTGAPADVMFNAARPWRDLEMGERPTGSDDLVYNVPMIIGARQGFPNFNEMQSRTTLRAIRRLTVEKPANTSYPNTLGSMRVTERLNFELENQFAVEAWHSYHSNRYQRPLSLYISNRVVVMLRSNNNVVSTLITGTNYFPAPYPNIPSNTYIPAAAFPLPSYSKQLFAWTNYGTADAGGFTNDLAVTVRNQLRYFLVDNAAPGGPRLVDAVTMSATNDFFDLARNLAEPGTSGSAALQSLWSRGNPRDRPWNSGVDNQISISTQSTLTDNNTWKNYGDIDPGIYGSKEAAIINFSRLMRTNDDVARVLDVPFVAVRYVTQNNYWEASDPLVHYTSEDLWRGSTTYPELNSARTEFGRGIGEPNKSTVAWPSHATNRDKVPSLRDPGVRTSDLWGFPTNRLPTIGWIGRVHRGTPWQSVYLKSEPASLPEFQTIVGGFPSGEDASLRKRVGTVRRSLSAARAMHPSVDARLLDVFTTSVHPNATRGRLSINQTNLAAWSAVFSGVDLRLAKRSIGGGGNLWQPTNYIAEPAALDTNLTVVVNAINRERSARQRDFHRVSELLSVPELTSASPYLRDDKFPTENPTGHDRITDADYERIPEQIFSLLKVGEPRFVIYSWGQSLKPAEFGVNAQATGVFPRGPSVETAGDLRGLVRNYQITGEMATRAVVRIGFDRLSNDPNSPLYDEFDYSRPHAVVESFNIVPPQ